MEQDVQEFMEAVVENDYPIVKQMLDDGLNPNVTAKGYPLSALWYAVESASPDIVSLLLDKGANPNLTSPKTGITVLMLAAKESYVKAVELLLKKGADVNAVDKKGCTALYYSVIPPSNVEHHPEVTEMLIEAGADPTKPNTDKQITPYMMATEYENPEILDILVGVGVEKGFKIGKITNAKDVNGQNAAFYVKPHYDDTDLVKDVIEKLYDNGVDLNAKDNLGRTPLMVASAEKMGEGAVGLLFLDYQGIDLDEVDNDGLSALFYALLTGPLMIVGLLEEGADVNYQEPKNGDTVLMRAVQGEGDVEIVKSLLSHGADTTLKNKEGKTALELTTNPKIRELLGPKVFWKGLTQSDVAIFDTFFEDPINYSCCPVCLGYTERSEACRYMTHDCSKQPGVVMHARLYNLYKNAEGKIAWCTICGRPCRGHRHYLLSPHESTVLPPLAPVKPGANYFGGEADCIADGGGGIAEKVKRLDRMRTWAKELQNEVGKIGEREAREQLVEEAWNAPLTRAPTARILETKKFTVPTSEFPAAAAPAEPAAEMSVPDIPKPADEVANVPEVIGAGGFDSIMRYDTAPVIRFIHKKKDGTVYRHTDQELVGKEGLEAFIENANRNFGLESFGYCFAPGCTAKLWPQDVKDFIEDAAVYEDYRKKFNEKFAPKVGGADKPLFVKITNLECAKPEKKKAGTYRRKQTKQKKTRRNNK